MIASTATETQISHYLHGWCPQLAAAIWEAVRWEQGWSLAILTDDDGQSGHVVIHTPAGEYLDIRGILTADEVRGGWSTTATLHNIDTDWLYERGWELGYTDEDLTAARILCTAVGIDVGEDDWESAERYAL